MKCLYEALGVDRDVDEGGLKKAYRKLALQWHPDKNQANLQEAEERFKEIQNAYEILIDPHERSWYDSHRESILRSSERYQAGGGGFEGGQRPADEEDLYQYFTTAAFSGFGDGPRGFYGVYDSLFERLAKQEAEAHQQRSASDRKGKRPPGPFPRFGFSDAPWPEVAAFYAAWSGFATVKDFAWADQYHTASAPNRRVRRAMEGENDKARRAAKREYNEAVRELVGFLRKRDKRVAAHQVEEARRREQRQAEDAARREAERQERLARAAAYQEAAWVRGEGGSEGDEESEEELAEEEQLVWYCMACEKHFKSAAAFDNHERSKKHLQQVELLRQVLEEEEAELVGAPLAAPSSDDEQLDGGSTLTSEEGSGSSSEEEEEAEIETETDQERGSVASSGSDSDASSATADGQSEGGTGRAGGQHAGRVQQRSEAEQPSEEEEGSSSEMGEDDMLARLVATQRPLSRQQQRRSQPDSGSEEEGSEEDVAAGSQGAGSAASGSSQQEEEEDEEKDELAQGTASQQPARHRHPADDVGALGQDLAAVELDAATASGGSGSDSDWGRKPASKHRGRRGKKRVSQRPAQQQQREPQEQQQHLSVEQPTVPQQVQGKLPAKEKRRQRQAAQRGAGQQVEELRCSLCRSEFATRNQLFKHLKTEHYG